MMNEELEKTIAAATALLERLSSVKEVNNVDELRLIVIRNRIADIQKIIDDFGKKLYERLENEM